MHWRFCPTCEAKTAFGSATIVLDKEWVVLCQVGLLNIGTRPRTRPASRGIQLSRIGADNSNTASAHSCAIGLDVVGSEDEIEIAIVFCQSVEQALLSFGWFAHGNQFKIGITDHDNPIRRATGGMHSAPACQQSQLFSE